MSGFKSSIKGMCSNPDVDREEYLKQYPDASEEQLVALFGKKSEKVKKISNEGTSPTAQLGMVVGISLLSTVAFHVVLSTFAVVLIFARLLFSKGLLR